MQGVTCDVATNRLHAASIKRRQVATNKATDQRNIILSPGLFAVDFLPWLHVIPE